MSLETFNKTSRNLLLQTLSQQNFDILIIGGGITGASLFRDAALRGMKAALVEARDFASATSGRSSKLIHGGLRYLKTLGFGLARESCHERNLHIRLNKRLVRPIPFLTPLYKTRGENRFLMRLGMIAYEALSEFRNYRFHRFLSREETLLLAPGIPVDGLTGGCLYYDAAVSDHRWTIEIIKDGVRSGGVAVNYCPATALLKDGAQVRGVRVADELTGSQCEITARTVVNATGVFADRIRQMDHPDAKQIVRISKGTHLVFSEEDVPLNITTTFSSPLDGRPLFLSRREGCFLFGTSDDWEETDPAMPVPGEQDVGYLLASLQRFMPEAELNHAKVQFVYSGFRPLLSLDSQENSSKATREDYVEFSDSGLISVVGGKLTTSRKTARDLLDRIAQTAGNASHWKKCRTHELSIGGTNEAVAEGLSHWVRQCPKMAGYFRILFQRYGLDAHGICEQAKEIYLGKHSDPNAEPIRAEVEYVCRNEMVCTVEDLIDRRAGFLSWNSEKRLERLRYGAGVIRRELSLSEEEFESQYRDYERHLQRFHSLPQNSNITSR